MSLPRIRAPAAPVATAPPDLQQLQARIGGIQQRASQDPAEAAADAAAAAHVAAALEELGPCFMCAETDWRRCHRRLIADQLVARGHEVVRIGAAIVPGKLPQPKSPREHRDRLEGIDAFLHRRVADFAGDRPHP